MADIEVQDMTIRYAGAAMPAIDGVNLSIPKGQFVLLSGPSGCGKSTLGLALAGFIPSRIPARTEGSIRVCGEKVEGAEIHDVARRVGFVFQNPDTQLVHLDVESEIVFGPENLGVSRTDIHRRLQAAVSSTDTASLLHRHIEELSGGQRQRVAIAATLAMQSQVLILDEPTSDLDPVGTYEVLQALRRLNEEQGITIVLIEHKIEEVIGFVQRVILMDAGQIVLDAPSNQAFADIELWDNLGVTVPDIVRLAHTIPALFPNGVPLTVDDAYTAMVGHPAVKGLRVTQDVIPPEIAKRLRAGAAKDMPKDSAVGFRQAGLAYREKLVLRDIDFHVERGEWVALVGANGSGKTSLAALAMGFVGATQGHVECFGQPVRAGKISRQAAKISFLFQAADKMLFSRTVRQELLFGNVRVKRKGEVLGLPGQSALAAAELMDLTPYLDREPFQLSHGQRKRLALASLLTKHPQLIILDEPTTGQDEKHANEFLHYLERLRETKSTGFFMITHDMRVASRYATRIAVLADGQILDTGAPEYVFTQSESLAAAKVIPPAIAELHLRLLGGSANWVATSVDDFLLSMNREGARI
ncbi:ABC transporter ATP-binding protein [Alicyclobacillus sp. SO9]|uniref:ABC transporter ATP-binding protein n=1 Tax=Alicyclobacillus sp. SO9 TaxID=2665646 RepID=UPI0018E833CC|nr:energy-coupling factor transporter ATPase [Alicyclobacillus sp. SO9]QQE78209.1 ATP-binding cassette domain-containing protein [Alicyclobacillus sp. SO9]